MNAAAQRARQELGERISGQLTVLQETLAGQEKVYANICELTERMEALGAILDGYRTRGAPKGQELFRHRMSAAAENLTFNALLDDFNARGAARRKTARGSRMLEAVVLECKQVDELRLLAAAEEEEPLEIDRPGLDEAYDKIERLTVAQQLEAALKEFLKLNARTQRQKLNFDSLRRHERARRTLFEELDNFTKLLPADAARPGFEQLERFVDVFCAEGESDRAAPMVLSYAARCLKLLPQAGAPREFVPRFLQLLQQTHAFFGARVRGGESALSFGAWAVREYRAFVSAAAEALRAARADAEFELEELKNETGAFAAQGLCLDFVLDELIAEARARKRAEQK